MDATIVPEVQKHYPVLLKEIISIISPQYGGTFIDCTFGQGGYSKKILEFEKTKVIALDRDIESETKANLLKNKFEDRFLFKNIKYILNKINNPIEFIRSLILSCCVKSAFLGRFGAKSSKNQKRASRSLGFILVRWR